ncbi:hypothetical protein OROMI_010807 [Orobanche minor]
MDSEASGGLILSEPRKDVYEGMDRVYLSLGNQSRQPAEGRGGCQFGLGGMDSEASGGIILSEINPEGEGAQVRPVGLSNLGMSCYYNTFLQLFLALQAVRMGEYLDGGLPDDRVFQCLRNMRDYQGSLFISHDSLFNYLLDNFHLERDKPGRPADVYRLLLKIIPEEDWVYNTFSIALETRCQICQNLIFSDQQQHSVDIKPTEHGKSFYELLSKDFNDIGACPYCMSLGLEITYTKRFTRLPRALIVINKFIIEPYTVRMEEKIDLGPLTIDGVTATYYLKAVIRHDEREDFGHLVAYVKYGDQWFLTNDRNVQSVQWDDVVRAGDRMAMLAYEDKP